MNTALLAASKIWIPLHGVLGWFKASPVSTSSATPDTQAPVVLPAAVNAVSKRIEPACHASIKRRAPRPPLRVVRILESDQTSAQVGRMVISGRMADVCAELDRLAACEAVPH